MRRALWVAVLAFLAALVFSIVPSSEVVQAQGPGGGGPDLTLKRKLQSWISLAQKKAVSWTFARDSADTVLTTLAADVSVGATSVTVASAAGVVAGRRYVIRNDRDIDIVEVQSIAGAVLTLTGQVGFRFFEGDRFRTEEYWPGVWIMGEEGVSSVPPLHYSLKFRFREEYP